MAAYLIGDITVTDASVYEEYRKHVPDIIASHGGKYLIRGGASQTVEGDWAAKRVVVLEFPTMDMLKTFYFSAAYAPYKAMRQSGSSAQMVLVEGI